MRLAQVLRFAERRLPAFAQSLKKRFVERGVPMNRSLGLRVVDVAPDSSRVVVRMPARRGNRNVGGTIHGAAIVALAETVHGIAVLWQFSPADHTMVTRDLRIEFLVPARGTLTSRFSLEEPVRRRIGEELGERGASDVELSSEVEDAQGRTVARLVASYAVRRRRQGEREERSLERERPEER